MTAKPPSAATVASRRLSSVNDLVDRHNPDAHVRNIDPFLVRKWDHAFAIFFDMNKDNQLEWADFELLIEVGQTEKIKTRRGKDSDDYRLALTAMQEIWRQLSMLADMNADNQISMDEWKHMWYATVNMEHSDAAWQKLYLDYMFKLFDAAGDDLVDLSEYVEVMSYYGIEKKQAVWAFDKFAVGANGQPVMAIDYARYCALWKEYFESTDHDAPGNFLFGDAEGIYNPNDVLDSESEAEDSEGEGAAAAPRDRRQSTLYDLQPVA